VAAISSRRLRRPGKERGFPKEETGRRSLRRLKVEMLIDVFLRGLCGAYDSLVRCAPSCKGIKIRPRISLRNEAPQDPRGDGDTSIKFQLRGRAFAASKGLAGSCISVASRQRSSCGMCDSDGTEFGPVKGLTLQRLVVANDISRPPHSNSNNNFNTENCECSDLSFAPGNICGFGFRSSTIEPDQELGLPFCAHYRRYHPFPLTTSKGGTCFRSPAPPLQLKVSCCAGTSTNRLQKVFFRHC
jgi:hypothetical protein